MGWRCSTARRALVALLCTLVAGGVAATTAGAAPPKAGWDRGKVRALIAQMTLEEKARMLYGAGDDRTCSATYAGCWRQRYLPGVPRLGVPPLRMADGPAGVRLGSPMTQMPAPVAMAATFDAEAARAYGSAIGREARAADQHVLLAPMVSLVRVPTAGRNFETLGEDPYLATMLAVPEIRGIQGEGVMASIKHFAENRFELERLTTNVRVGERAMHEMELAPFEAAVKEADVATVMCSYNRLNGPYACSSPDLLQRVLRDLWGFRGIVRSDGGATHAVSDLLFGTDVEMPLGRYYTELVAAGTNGTPAVPATPTLPAVPAVAPETWRAAIDVAVGRVLGQMDRFRLLDGTPPARPDLRATRRANARLAEQIAVDGATLLRNERAALPLSRGELREQGLAVIGPAAVVPPLAGRGSSQVVPKAGISTPLEALRAAVGRRIRVVHEPGFDLDGAPIPQAVWAAQRAPIPTPTPTPTPTVTPAPPPATPAPPATQSQIQAPTPTPTATPTPTPPDSGGAPVDDAIRGLLRERIQRAEIDEPAVPQPGGAPPRIDPVVDYTGRRSLPRRSAWRWTGVLRAPSDGAYDLRLQAIGHRRAVLRVDDRVRVRLEPLTRHGIGVEPQAIKTRNTSPVLHQGFARVRLRKGEQRRIELRVNAHSRQPLRVRLAWTTPEERREVLGRAVRAARKATAAVVFAQDDAGEAEDQPSLALPAPQDDLISAVARANRRTIVVLNTGGPVTMPWVRRVPSILEMWYPGERGAEATAQILLGRAAPGGKLPVTFPTDWRRQPTYSRDGSRYPGVFLDGQPFRTVLHDEGVFAGYRWYDAEGVKPLFAFGHGLSYTSFRYSGLRVARRGEAIAVTFTVENAGSRRADEVAQVYLGRPRGAPVRMPQRTLAAVRRLDLPAGRRRTVTVTIDGRWQSYWREATDEWVRPRGARAIGVGGASDDIRLRGQVGG